MKKTNDEWKKELDPLAFNVCRLGATETPFSGKYTHTKDTGTYICVACRTPLFNSETKFDSGTGWPSFWDVVNKENIKTTKDMSLEMKRIEVKCKNCDSHLGHVFDDGPKETGLRYCINSAALNFIPKK